MQSDCCAKTDIHPEHIRLAAGTMPAETQMQDAGELFKILGDQTRMRMICALLATELCVCDLSELLAMSQSAISHQLRILRQARLVRYRRDGKNAYYSLADQHIRAIVQLAIEHTREIYHDLQRKDPAEQHGGKQKQTTAI